MKTIHSNLQREISYWVHLALVLILLTACQPQLLVVTATGDPALTSSTNTSIPTVMVETPTSISFPTAGQYGISLVLDEAIPLEDGYYLVGHSLWTDKRIASVEMGGGMTAVDDAGRTIPVEPVNPSSAGLDTLKAGQWVYKLYGKLFTGR